MKIVGGIGCVGFAVIFAASLPVARAHNLTGDPAHPHEASSVDSPGKVTRPGRLVVRAEVAANRRSDPGASAVAVRPVQAEPFVAFAPQVNVRWEGDFLYVESKGLPAHGMMVGITAWQQQVPLPQSYFGDNAWRIPLRPVVSERPLSIHGRFLRGAIALAANGIPIFNPQNNRGEVSQEIGELDEWGGHCGRADDYHYHAAPLHLQAVVGPGKPIAYALDGYAIYGLTEPDGANPDNLDAFNGHETAGLGYHYHASLKYPYVNGGFHGEVVERDGQVDPQPRAQSVRPALTGLRGAKITVFSGTPGQTLAKLDYTVNGKPGSVSYAALDGGAWSFRFVGADGTTRDETYRGGGGGGAGREKGKKGGDAGKRKQSSVAPARAGGVSVAPLILTPNQSGNFVLRSSVAANGAALPTEFTGDGAGISPPLEWSGAPAGTKAFAVVMDHLAPGNDMKCYWTMWDIPADVTSLPKSAQGIGRLGPGFKGALGYEPPHSQGPGLKTYMIHVYALGAAPQLDRPPREVTREVLLTAIKDSILDSAELKVTYTRPEAGDGLAAPQGDNTKKGKSGQ